MSQSPVGSPIDRRENGMFNDERTVQGTVMTAYMMDPFEDDDFGPEQVFDFDDPLY